MSIVEDAETKLINEGNEEAAMALETFETRWRYAVFPAMVAFFILSAFGFYLIYGILQRMESISDDIARMTVLMEKSVPVISNDISDLNNSISTTLPRLENDVDSMSNNVSNISTSATSMAYSTHNMGQSTWELNRSISKPMRAMNKMIPWNVKTPQPPYYPSYWLSIRPPSTGIVWPVM